MKHESELLVPGLKKLIFLKYNFINRAQGIATYIKSDYSASSKAIYGCGCFEVQIDTSMWQTAKVNPVTPSFFLEYQYFKIFLVTFEVTVNLFAIAVNFILD